MRLNSLSADAAQKLEPTARAQLLLSVAAAVLPALTHLPKTLKTAEDAIHLASRWKPNGPYRAEDLYSFVNSNEIDGLAFQESVATNSQELAAIIAVTMAYYYTVWCAYVAEGKPDVPEDVEAVPTEAFQGVFKYSLDSAAVRESDICEILEKFLANQSA